MYTNANEFAAALTAAFAKVPAGVCGHTRFEVEQGRKFARIISRDDAQGSAFCFIDAEGNIYKAATYKTPAKGVRATLATLPADFADKLASLGYASTGWLYR